MPYVGYIVGKLLGSFLLMWLLTLGIRKVLGKKLTGSRATVISWCCAAMIGVLLSSLMGAEPVAILFYPAASLLVIAILIWNSST